MPNLIKPDLCVIGGGSAGLTVAAAARAFDASVVLIENGRMGGDCLNTGCVPSKALIAAARQAYAAETAPAFGVDLGMPAVDFERVHAHVHDVIAGIAPHDSEERFTALGATVIRAHARFADRRTLVAGDTGIRARRFVVATGSRPAVPPIEGIADVPYYTNETIFDLSEKPGHLIIIGGGPIGMELAQAYRRLGARVTVIEVAEPLGRDDPELTAVALRRIETDGVVVRAKTSVETVARDGSDIAVTIASGEVRETVTGTHLLVAAGRTPNTADLGLDAARVKTDPAGIRVNASLKTSNRRIYAIGDVVAGGQQFTHVAGYHGGLVVRSALFGLPAKQATSIIPHATYTDPEVATVGLDESTARDRLGDRFKIMRWSYGENDRARTDRRTDGVIKLITDRKGKILGCGIAGAEAGELINLFAFAIANGLKVGSLTKFVAPYPTLCELAKRVGIAFYQDKLANPWIARWMRLIRLLP